MIITPMFIVTLLCAALCGYVGGRLQERKPRKRHQIPNGSALQRQPDPVWARWDASFGKELRR